jgi:hypothetical protein
VIGAVKQRGAVVIHRGKLTLSSILILVLFTRLDKNTTRQDTNPNKDRSQTPFLEIRLRDIGYEPAKEYHYPGTGIPRDLSILNDDSKKRLAFINERVLAVYFSHLPVTEKGGPGESRSMEALFVDLNTGSLISRKAWATRQRKWVNEREDTEARILPVRDGFLVHAGNSLTLYSVDQREKTKLSLDDTTSWAAVVAVLGNTVHIQQHTGNASVEGRWFAADTLKQLAAQKEVAGITSASDHAVVTELAHCVQLQAIGEPPRDLCCFDPCRLGLPEFLSDKEILSVYRNGFVVLSDHGEKLWGREVAVSGNGIIADYGRSLDGTRFAIALSSDHSIAFDQVQISKGSRTIVVYDRSSRSRVFVLPLGSVEPFSFAFAFSPNGDILAVLISDTLRLYRVASRLSSPGS